MAPIHPPKKKISIRAAVCGLAGMALGGVGGYFLAMGDAGPTATVVASVAAIIGLHEGAMRGRLMDLRAARRAHTV